jgi:hypothetical protein
MAAFPQIQPRSVVQILFVTPEALRFGDIRTHIKGLAANNHLNRIIIDEAHVYAGSDNNGATLSRYYLAFYSQCAHSSPYRHPPKRGTAQYLGVL